MELDRWKKIYWSLFAAVFVLIMASITLGRPIYYAIWFGIAFSWIIALKRGFKNKEVLSMISKGINRAWVVITVVTLTGALIGIWMVSGTVGSLMYYGFNYLSRVNFLLVSFLITTLVSLVIGTSIGTTSTVGLALLGIGRSLGIPTPLMAGAIVSGAFVGDKTSPLSGITNLTSAVTETELSKNLPYGMRTTIIPYIITAGIYFVMGQKYTSPSSNQLIEVLQSSFDIGIIPILPVIVLIALILMKFNIRVSMITSILLSILVGIYYQQVPLREILYTMVMGFDGKELPIASVLWGGGIISMKNVIIMLFSATGFNGIVEGIGIVKSIIGNAFENISDRFTLIIRTAILSLVSAMVGCNQALAVIVPAGLLNSKYDEMGIDRKLLGRTIMDSGVMLAPLIPWNVNGMAMAATMKIRVVEYIPFAFLCYLIPIMALLVQRFYFRPKIMKKSNPIAQTQ